MNLNGPNGFRPVRANDGTIRMEERTIASGYATGLFFGDPVKSAAAGGGIVEASLAADTNLGMFAGCSFDDDAGRPKFSRYWPAGQVATNIKCWVYTDSDLRFLVQTTTVAAANIGQTCDMVTGAGDPATGNSGTQIDGGSYGVGLAFKVVALSPAPDNAYGQYGNVEVVMALSEL